MAATLHTGLWTDPMVVFGSGRYRDRFGPYLHHILRSHWVFGVLLAAAFAAAAWAFALAGQMSLAAAFAGLAVGAPLTLYLWLVRRTSYILLQPRTSALAGALYLVTLLVAASVAARLNLLGPATGLVLMGACAFSAALVLLRSVRNTFSEPSGPVEPGEVQRMHLDYGRWSALSLFLGSLPGQVPYLLLPAFHGLAASGAYRALGNLVMPVAHANTALSGLLVPSFVRGRYSGRLPATVRVWLVYFLLVNIAYWLVLVAFHRPLVELVYGDRYKADSWMLVVLGLGPVVGSLNLVFGAGLRALERADLVARAAAAHAVAGVAICLVLVPLWGTLGAAVGSLLSLVTGAVFYLSVWRKAG